MNNGDGVGEGADKGLPPALQEEMRKAKVITA